MDVKRAEMSYALYEDVIRTESERAEITVDIYESADCVRDHDFRTETNTQQPQQQTDGWLYYKCSFYYISSETKSWTESRRHCTERGADLVIINNTEKQKTVDKMQDGKTGFWIGLTDSEEEGNWKWVDGSALNSGLWGSGQPNGRTSENCAVSYSSGFHDYPCNTNFKWICEKNILERTLKDQDFFII
ncbi:C-type lectin domain family 4 member M-like isoform X9 [Carassius gibelio]|uniref:C-type lectin domain family 4 member M-like isoform X9 n=1 Tax=Carassius gibelio TaxID=101364 RepID=UPI002278F3A4|nr:C-type lectin domain family 4 member M-like isoform X9 [Carassius gibelio]